MRQIAVEDGARPGTQTVIYQSQRPAWALVSPNGEWIAINERSSSDGGGARLFQHAAGGALQYQPADATGNNPPGLREDVWKAYLNASKADANTPRRNVTIDATGWDNNGQKLTLAVTHLATPDQPDVPEPWSCTYDLKSKQIEPVSGQPAVDPATLAAAQTQAEQADNEETAPAEDAAGNPFADNNATTDADQSDATETGEEVADDNQFPGEKFPATRLDELTVPDVNESSLAEITYAINEMFARHGAEFKDKKVAKEFEQFPWYKPRPGVTYDTIENEFSELEKQNVKVLGRCRDAKLAATHHRSRAVRGQRAHEEGPNGAEIMQRVLEGIGAMP